MIFAETERLVLRSLRRDELPRLTVLLNDWDMVRWLSVVPFPYTMKDAGDFFADISPHDAAGSPQFFALALKEDDLLIGGIGLHPPRGKQSPEGQIEIGYWLGRDFWGRGLMVEAAKRVLAIGFTRADVTAIGATTDPKNAASQNVLHKIGLRDLGIVPRDYETLRGGDTMIAWRLTRDEYRQGLAA